jgi:hypothetical protein
MENKSNIPNKHPYKVPNKYFDTARQEILNKTVRETTVSKSYFKPSLSLGFGLSFLIVLGVFIFPTNPTNSMVLPNTIAVEENEYDLHYELIANDMDADIIDAALELDLDEELDELILSSIDGDINSTDLYINDFELELEYYEIE